MIGLVVLALVSAASAQFQGQQSFGAPLGQQQFASGQLLPPVFPVPQTRFAPASSFSAPVNSFRAPVSSFGAPVNSFGAPLASGRPLQLDTPAFVDQGVRTGFQGQRSQPAITIVERNEVIDPAGQYSSSFRDSAGSSISEQGHLKPTNDHKDNVVVKDGSYSYVDNLGKTHQVTYVADEYGFRPISDDIPVAPLPLH